MKDKQEASAPKKMEGVNDGIVDIVKQMDAVGFRVDRISYESSGSMEWFDVRVVPFKPEER